MEIYSSSHSPHRVYLDHNATAPLRPRVRSGLLEAAEKIGNPSSIHWAGREAKEILRHTRRLVADYFSVSPLEILFTSGATESNTTVLRSGARWLDENPSHPRREWISMRTEHPSIVKTLQQLEVEGHVVHWIPADRSGLPQIEELKKKLGSKTFAVVMMAGNNETGTLLPVEDVARASAEAGAYFHCDGVQALGKIPFSLAGISTASFSAHKFGGLKGLGILFVQKGFPLRPLLLGGRQERARRAGTENLLGIWSVGAALEEIAGGLASEQQQMRQLRDRLESEILRLVPRVSITSDSVPRLPNTSSFVIDAVDGETLLMSLDLLGYAVSTGAACSSGNPEPSPVLLAMGLTRSQAQNSLRLSLGPCNLTDPHVLDFPKQLQSTVERIRKIASETHAGPRRSETA